MEAMGEVMGGIGPIDENVSLTKVDVGISQWSRK